MNMKETASRLKEKAGNMGTKTWKTIIFGGIGIVVFAVIIALILNHKDYAVLYSGVSTEEAAEVVSKLQELGASYQYKGNGDVLVDKKEVDLVRAQLAMEGYPKNSFAYDIFIDHAGGMTTDSDKQTYKLYELQNRIGATIGLFEGVKDAKVTIALGETQRYVLQESSDRNGSSASVVVIMKDGGSPAAGQVAAIQRLVATSVAGMPLENVSVIDGNGVEVSSRAGAADGQDNGNGEELAQMVENQITGKVMNLLGAIYGAENVRVSVKCRVNMEKLIRETMTYSTPDKIDETDKTGIVSKESISEDSGEGVSGTGGVAGAETNSDVTQYAGAAGGTGTSSYLSSSETREYVINQVKEQGQVPAGALEDLSVSVVVNGKDFGDLNQNQLKSLIGNAAGVSQDAQGEKITVVSAPFYKSEKAAAQESAEHLDDVISSLTENPLILLIGGGILLFLILLIVLFAALGRRRKKKKKRAAVVQEVPVASVIPENNPEINKIQNEKAHGLRENVRDFTDQNPEISAQLLKSWLNGGEQHGG